MTSKKNWLYISEGEFRKCSIAFLSWCQFIQTQTQTWGLVIRLYLHMYLLVLLSDPILIMKVSTLPLMIYWTNIMMKVFVFTSALLVLASADTCTDCTAVVSTIAARLMTEESIAAQQAILLSSMYLVGNLVKPTSIVSSIPHHNSLPSNQQILIG